jgi:transcriptional regulator with XRE-family HTH domain
MKTITFSERVRAEVRAELGRQGVKQIDFAPRLGVAQSTLSRWMTGEAPLSLDELEHMANELHVPVEKFIPHHSLAQAS